MWQVLGRLGQPSQQVKTTLSLLKCADCNLLSRRRSKQPEQLQINPGKEATPNSRRGSVGSVGSADLPGGSDLDIVEFDSWIDFCATCKSEFSGSAKKTPGAKAVKAAEPAATPKSGKKQVSTLLMNLFFCVFLFC